MKKTILTLLCLVVSLLCLVTLVSCNDEINAPGNLKLNEDTLTLTWDRVLGAKSYTIVIEAAEYEKTTKNNKVELENLDPGTYEIRIKANSDSTETADSDWVTYTFVIQNSGNQAVLATDNAVITDTFDPILTDLTVTFNGTPWTEGTQYTYDPVTGQFATLPGALTVPAATYTQDPVTGAYSATPGIATLVVTGTI